MIIKFLAEALGFLTILIVVLYIAVCLMLIFRVASFRAWLRRGDAPQLQFFDGPWLTRIILIIISIFWSFAETFRLRFSLGRASCSISWQRNICKIYLCSLGFSEPAFFITLALLLQSSLRKIETGVLSRWWNKQTIAFVLLFSLPVFVLQFFLVFIGPDVLSEFVDIQRAKLLEFFTRTSYATEDNIICTYPLSSTSLLGLFYTVLICYVLYIGIRLLTSVINRRLRQRLYFLFMSLVFCVPARLLLVGFSIVFEPWNLEYQLVVFAAFFAMLLCVLTCIVVLVYFPLADSMELRELDHMEIQVTICDD